MSAAGSATGAGARSAAALSPQAALYGSERALPLLPACVHYAGSERFIRKALVLQAGRGPVFDIACDCEDGAPVGAEREHARALAALIAGADNRFDRVGARIHDVRPRGGATELGSWSAKPAMVSRSSPYPRSESARGRRAGSRGACPRGRPPRAGSRIPVVVLVETHGAVHDTSAIAALPASCASTSARSTSSAPSGRRPRGGDGKSGPVRAPAPPSREMRNRGRGARSGADPGPRRHPRNRRSRSGVRGCPARPGGIGFLRMSSIHPSQIDAIVRACNRRPAKLPKPRPCSRQRRQSPGRRWPWPVACTIGASYRYFWTVLQRAQAAGAPIPAPAAAFFAPANPYGR